MNKFGIIIGVAAVATLAGCKDPNYAGRRSVPTPVDNDVKKVVKDEPPVQPIEIEAKVVEKKCQCAPGTVHTEPCACGAADCKCVVKAAPVLVPVPNEKKAEVKPAEPETTTYVVQRGDYLAKISKKYNVTIPAIKRLNPQIKDDNKVMIGQKIKLPGKVDVGEQKVPAVAPAAKGSAKVGPSYKAPPATYDGPTKEYVVKGGDTLGAIAYGNGITIRALKGLNSLTSDNIVVGQKLKVPADGKALAEAKAAAKAKSAKKDPVVEKKTVKALPVANEAKPQPVANEKAAVPAAVAKPDESVTTAVEPASVEDEPQANGDIVEPEPIAGPAPADPSVVNYTVLEGEDIIGLAIKFNITRAQIRELNNFADDTQLTPGQVIKIPANSQQ